MTRLTDKWVADVADTIDIYDRDLEKKIGLNLRALSFLAAKREREDVASLIKDNKAAVIRMNTGEGVISGFDRAVAAILNRMGIETLLLEYENAAGINEAVDKGANILFMADDEKYIALNINNNKKSDNDNATALGYVTALDKMASGLNGRDVALLGYGRVGHIAAHLLFERGASVHIYDKKKISRRNLSKNGYIIIDDIDRIANFKLIFDSTNEGIWLHNNIAIRDAFIVAPGVPLSFDLEYFQRNNLIVHDMLQIGTGVMLAEVI